MNKTNNTKSSKKVTWSPKEVSIRTIDYYQSACLNKRNIWYSRDELREIRAINQSLASLYAEETGDIVHDEIRGLEAMTEQGGWRRFQYYHHCINRVLDEQDRQRGIDKADYHAVCIAYPLVKRINHLHIPFDHDRLGALCRDATARARREAYSRGKKDYQVIKDEQIDWKEQLPNLMMSSQVTKAKDVEDCDTTVASYESYLDLDESFSEHTFGDEDKVEVEPTTPCVPALTQEALQKKYQERYAQYLVKRQARIEAQEKADQEWEERRLERKAAIWADVDISLRQLGRIVDLSNEMCQLVVTSRSA